MSILATVKTQMKCQRMRNFIRAFTVCFYTLYLVRKWGLKRDSSIGFLGISIEIEVLFLAILAFEEKSILFCNHVQP